MEFSLILTQVGDAMESHSMQCADEVIGPQAEIGHVSELMLRQRQQREVLSIDNLWNTLL